jgi:hypothetical protein
MGRSIHSRDAACTRYSCIASGLLENLACMLADSLHSLGVAAWPQHDDSAQRDASAPSAKRRKLESGGAAVARDGGPGAPGNSSVAPTRQEEPGSPAGLIITPSM